MLRFPTEQRGGFVDGDGSGVTGNWDALFDMGQKTIDEFLGGFGAVGIGGIDIEGFETEIIDFDRLTNGRGGIAPVDIGPEIVRVQGGIETTGFFDFGQFGGIGDPVETQSDGLHTTTAMEHFGDAFVDFLGKPVGFCDQEGMGFIEGHEEGWTGGDTPGHAIGGGAGSEGDFLYAGNPGGLENGVGIDSVVGVDDFVGMTPWRGDGAEMDDGIATAQQPGDLAHIGEIGFHEADGWTAIWTAAAVGIDDLMTMFE